LAKAICDIMTGTIRQPVRGVLPISSDIGMYPITADMHSMAIPKGPVRRSTSTTISTIIALFTVPRLKSFAILHIRCPEYIVSQ
jgi:hypothetical protein